MDSTRGCTDRIEFDGIHDQIQNDLLQLDLIAKHRRNLIVEFQFKINLMFPQIDVDQLQNCPDQFVDIDLRFFLSYPF